MTLSEEDSPELSNSATTQVHNAGFGVGPSQHLPHLRPAGARGGTGPAEPEWQDLHDSSQQQAIPEKFRLGSSLDGVPEVGALEPDQVPAMNACK